jgi:hypothetical protein
VTNLSRRTAGLLATAVVSAGALVATGAFALPASAGPARPAGLLVLHLPTSLDDTAWATSARGALFTTDAAADTVDMVYGNLAAGTAYTAVTPCNANSAPATCPAAGFPVNYLGTVSLRTGAIVKVPLTGAALQPKGLIFARF